jgi:hypothetical protein
VAGRLRSPRGPSLPSDLMDEEGAHCAADAQAWATWAETSSVETPIPEFSKRTLIRSGALPMEWIERTLRARIRSPRRRRGAVSEFAAVFWSERLLGRFDKRKAAGLRRPAHAAARQRRRMSPWRVVENAARLSTSGA